MTNGCQTKLVKANTLSGSIRTTIPAFIINQFQLSPGDELIWSLHVNDGILEIKLSPIKNLKVTGADDDQ